MGYTTTYEVWKNLGRNAYTKVRDEIVGTGNGTATTFSLPNDNIISTSVNVYTDNSLVTSSAYTLDLDDGKVIFNTGSTPTTGVVVSTDYSYSDVPDSWVNTLINQATEELNSLTRRNFETTSSTEYFDMYSAKDNIFLSNYPVINLTLSSNIGDNEYPNWLTLSTGSDYVFDSSSGHIQFVSRENVYNGIKNVKAVYDAGYSTIPYLVNELAILLTTRKLINSNVYKSIETGQDGFTPIRLEEVENRINSIVAQLRKQKIEAI